MTNINFAFWGSSRFSIICLDELKNIKLLPKLIIATPDVPAGRGLKITVNPVKTWAENNNIECLTPSKLDGDFLAQLQSYSLDLFLVSSYGKIIPKNIVELPKHGTLNIHPSLLPKYRGASPLQQQILNDEKNIGVTLMLMDEKMDHGAILAQETVNITNWPINFEQLEEITAKVGIKIFADKIDDWVTGRIKPIEQNHTDATFTKKVEKIAGLLDLEFNKPYDNYLRTLAYHPWPGTFFFINKNGIKTRVIIKDSEYTDNKFIIRKVLPEGKKEMNYDDFLRGIK